VEGVVFMGEDKLENARIVLYKNGEETKTFVTSSSGKFSFSLTPDNEYLLKFSKSGLVTKSLTVSTKGVPTDEMKKGEKFKTQPQVYLFEELEGMDYSALNEPIGKLYYNHSVKNFDYDIDYSRKIKVKIEKVEREQTKKVAEKKEKELQTKTEKSASVSNTSSSTSAVNSAVNKEEAEALKKSKADAELKAKIDAETKAKTEEEAKQKAMDEKYIAAIATADRAFNSKEFNTAKFAYTEASTIKPTEIYPKNKIAEIDKIIAEEKYKTDVEEKYSALIEKADKSFELKSYISAKTDYREALQYKSEEKYPKEKLQEINKIIKEKTTENTTPKATTAESLTEKITNVDLFVMDLALKYEQGMTEEIHEDAAKKIIRRIVVKGEIANEYTKVIYKFGTYYFKNRNTPSSESVWKKETEISKDSENK